MGGSRLCFWSSVAEAGAGRVAAHLPAQKPVPVRRPGQRPEHLAWVKPAVPSCSAPFEAAESRPSFSACLGPQDAGGTLTQQLESRQPFTKAASTGAPRYPRGPVKPRFSVAA